MAYDTKADFAADFQSALIDPITHEKYAFFKDESKYPGQIINIRLHYHRLVYFSGKEKMADRLISKLGITSADSLVMFGGAFGWLGEWLILKTGCSAVSVDTSQWINDTKDLSQDDDLREAITAGGLDPDSGHGLTLFNKYSDPTPRAKIPIVNELMDTKGSRNRVESQLTTKTTRIITEEVWQTLTDTERTEYKTRMDNFNAPYTHIIDNQII